MTWRYNVLGIHTHVSVYMNGALCGKLCFRNEEFATIQSRAEALGYDGLIDFVDEDLERDRDRHRSDPVPE